MQNLSGQVIKSYQMIEKIGAGGFGVVYRAYQENVDREVAIKVILPHHANHPDFIKRFDIEAQIVARLEHPHIVPLYDYWREPNGAYIVMRYLRAGAMRDHLEQQVSFSLSQIVQMIVQISSALMMAHKNGVVHRDLKSDNILLDDTFNAYLSDFGIAKDLGQNSNITRDSILGTPAYLAPEQIRGETATTLTDIYALGILAYEILTGAKPFFDMTPASVLFKQLNDPLPDINLIRPELPAELNRVLQQATAKDASSRYQSALEFARDFQIATQVSTSTVVNTLHNSPLSPGYSVTDAENAAFAPQNPYKGLRAFQQADASDFFGRGALVKSLLEHILDEDNDRFLAVVGPSGSGKSSVVKAGVLPALQVIENKKIDWFITEMMPGTHPFEELEASLLSIATMALPGLLEQLRSDDRGLVRATKRLLPDNENTRLLLFIDQFEEIFTLIDSEQERELFLNNLLNAVNDPRSQLYVVITMRADFYDRPLHYADFGELIRRNTELVLPLNAEELEATIVNPAKRVGITMETGLVNAIVADVKQQPGALPLLQYALTELFEHRNGQSLTLDAYLDIGGTSGALAKRAEDLFKSFDEAHQAIIRQMLLRLVNIADGVEDTRRRVLQSELLSLGQDRAMMQTVVDAFGKYRLLTFDRDPQTRSSTVEVAHEALIRKWERLHEWLDQNREGLRIQRQLTNTALEWRQSGHDKSFLLRGARLEGIEEWHANSELSLNRDEADFLKASIQERQNQQELERQRQAREAELEQRARNRMRALAIFMTIAALVGSILAVLAITAQQMAIRAQIEAEASENNAQIARAEAEDRARESRALALAANVRNVLAENNQQLALALALEAKQIFRPVLPEVQQLLASVAFGPGAHYRFDEHQGSVMSVSITDDNRYGASSSMDQTVRLWDLETGKFVATLSFTDEFVLALDFNPEGDQLALALSDGSARMFSVPALEEIWRADVHEDLVRAIAVSPDGRMVATGGIDHLIQLLDAENGDIIRTLNKHEGTIFSVKFSSDSQRLISGAGDATLADTSADVVDRTLRLWDVNTGDELLVISPGSGTVRTVAYAPNGKTVAAGVWDGNLGGTVRIYSTETGEEIRRFFAHTTVISDLTYMANSNHIISAAWDTNVIIWDIIRGNEEMRFSGFADRILTIALSANEEYLMMGLGDYGNNEIAVETDRPLDTSIYYWDLKSRDVLNAFTEHNDWLWSVAMHPAGELVATGSGPLSLPDGGSAKDTSVRIWDIHSGEQMFQLVAHTNTVDGLDFHPDGRRLLTGSWDRSMILWDFESETPLRTYTHVGAIYDVNFNTDGSQFIAAGRANADGIGNVALLFDTETGELIRTFGEGDHGSYLTSAVFSPDNTMILTSCNDNNIRLYDVASGDLIRTFKGHQARVNEVLFAPDGQTFASTSWDVSVRLWDVASGREIGQFIGHQNYTFGLAFSSDGQLLFTTSTDETVRMWDIPTRSELNRYAVHSDWIQEVVLSPDESLAVSAAQDGTAKVLRVLRDADAIEAFARRNRYVPILSCAERDRYKIPSPECAE